MGWHFLKPTWSKLGLFILLNLIATLAILKYDQEVERLAHRQAEEAKEAKRQALFEKIMKRKMAMEAREEAVRKQRKEAEGRLRVDEERGRGDDNITIILPFAL